MQVHLPPVFAVHEQQGKSYVRQLARAGHTAICSSIQFQSGKQQYLMLRSPTLERPIVLVKKGQAAPGTTDDAIQSPTSISGETIDLRDSRWLRHPLMHSQQSTPREHLLSGIRASWQGSHPYAEEVLDEEKPGLREPQLGALHAIRAHWTVSKDVATIVMPTGTGKTDTMLATLVTERCERLLVIVPTDALRTQLADKFLSLGILKTLGVALISAAAEYPVVCALAHKPATPEEARSIFLSANVTITTSAIAGACTPEVHLEAAKAFTHLFIDEAHHAEAPTWKRFKLALGTCKVLQFTATPFRDDDQPIDGRIIYNYPLRRAQERGYFRPIRFRPVVEFSPKNSDSAIANAALAQLQLDSAYGHILMARVENIKRAQEVFRLYEPHTEYHPIQLHTGISAGDRAKAKRMLLSGQTRIVVCVDMLGEGFDLPHLKIAAFHDIRKSLPVTLQFAGRFTRAKAGLGDATFIANTADIYVREAIQKLYSQDPDWNSLLPDIADKLVKDQVDLQEFLRDFSTFSADVPLRTVEPAASCVAYRTSCKAWNPSNFRDGIPGIDSAGQVYSAVNSRSTTLVVAIVSRTLLEWTSAEAMFGLDWHLYVAHWDTDHQLLYINASANAGTYERLAKALCGDSVAIVDGQDVFRVFHGVNRLTLNSVGLTEVLGRNVRYTGRMGSDVESGLGAHTKQKATKSVLSGSGFCSGAKVTVGASKGGRIWSKQRLRVHSWVAWCKSVGAKLVDGSIDTDAVLSGTLQTVIVTLRPKSMPIAIEWPEVVWREVESLWDVRIDGEELPLAEVSLTLVNADIDGAIMFALRTGTVIAEHTLQLSGLDPETARFSVEPERNISAEIRRGRGSWIDVAKFLHENPPTVWFADGGALEGNRYVNPGKHVAAFPRDAIQVIDWSNIDIRRESQGAERDPATIQGRMMQIVANDNPEILFDDDGAGEAADIVSASLATDATGLRHVNVDLYHCKYSGGDRAGARVGDLYEVCGQAQRSVHWKNSQSKGVDLLSHIMRRDASKLDSGGSTRFQVGDTDKAMELRRAAQTCPMQLRVHIVQPGLSRGLATPECLHLLGVTQTYLFETYQVELIVHASP